MLLHWSTFSSRKSRFSFSIKQKLVWSEKASLSELLLKVQDNRLEDNYHEFVELIFVLFWFLCSVLASFTCSLFLLWRGSSSYHCCFDELCSEPTLSPSPALSINNWQFCFVNLLFFLFSSRSFPNYLLIRLFDCSIVVASDFSLYFPALIPIFFRWWGIRIHYEKWIVSSRKPEWTERFVKR